MHIYIYINRCRCTRTCKDGAPDKGEMSTNIQKYFKKMSGPDKKGRGIQQAYSPHVTVGRRKFYTRYNVLIFYYELDGRYLRVSYFNLLFLVL